MVVQYFLLIISCFLDELFWMRLGMDHCFTAVVHGLGHNILQNSTNVLVWYLKNTTVKFKLFSILKSDNENKSFASFHRLSDDFDRKVGPSKNCTLILISSMKLKSWPDSNSCNTFYKLPLLCRGLNSKWEMEAYSHEIWKTSYCTLEEVRSERILSKVSHRWSDPLPAHFLFLSNSKHLEGLAK